MPLTPSQLLREHAAKMLGYSRFAIYSLEAYPIIWTRKLVGLEQTLDPPPPENHLEYLMKTTQQMLEQDQRHLDDGLYPLELILPEHPLQHFRRYAHLLWDAYQSSRRVKDRLHKEFSAEAKRFLGDVPEYYQRNFHNQTDGYLTEESADLYTHQTEILFRGSIGLMRRLLLAPLLRHIREQGRSLRVLELGCGGGEATEVILRSCPNVDVVAVDLSEPYLQMAKKRLAGFKNVRFVAEAAEKYRDEEKFDVVVSAFLFHELPHKIRVQVIETCQRMLKPDGMGVLMDSLQLGDDAELDWALLQFPRDFHEPFYANYVRHPLEEMALRGFETVETRQSFLSKSLHLRHPRGS